MSGKSPVLEGLSDHDAAAAIVFGVQRSAYLALDTEGDDRFQDPNIIAHAAATLLMKNGFHR